MENLFDQKIHNTNDLFDDHFLNARALYLYRFNRLPNLSDINRIDGERSFDAIKEKFGKDIIGVYEYKWHENKKKTWQFSRTLVLLENRCLLELGTDYCEIWHDGEQPGLVAEITALITPLIERQRREPLEINMVVHDKNKLSLKAMEIKRTKLDIGLFYGEQFRQTDELIRKRLNRKNDKGIVLLHGLPGAGKTTYLRYLIGKLRKRILFLSPSVAGNLMNPEFVELLIKNPNTVVIIEDAENIIMDRKHSPGSSVSNLLNISDGLLADFLNVQLVCTFNNSLTLIDNALLRKGRLIAKHEFGKLTVAQSQRLSNHLGFDTVIGKPMTIAEIANQHEKQETQPASMETIGFRQHVLTT